MTQTQRDRAAHADNIRMSDGASGGYSLATIGAKHVIDAAAPLVVDAIAAMQLPRDLSHFYIADYGCADGGTSLAMMRAALQCIRDQSPNADIGITYSDQPRNDFNALVAMVHGAQGGEFASYLPEFARVYPSFSANSFYLQTVADDCLHLGFSATAMHWLSGKPADIDGHIHSVGAKGEALHAFAKHAARDWRTILLHRARELKRGGRLVLANFCRDEQGRYLGNTGGANMFDTFNQIWQGFVADGVIGAAEYLRMTLPQYYNSVEEFCAPLQDETDECHRAGLRLHSVETRLVECPFAARFRRDGDAVKFADGLIPSLRSWNESVFFGALDATRPLPERREIIEAYYDAYRGLVLQRPDEHGMDYVHAYMVIAKV